MLENEHGEEMDLSFGSPAMLKHQLIASHDKKTYRELEQQLRDSGAWKHEEHINWEVIRKFLRNAKIKSTHKSALLNLLTDTVPTTAWLWAHGWKIDPKCEKCGELEDMDHVWEGCNGCEKHHDRRASFQNATKAKKVPPLISTTDRQTGKDKTEVRCYIN